MAHFGAVFSLSDRFGLKRPRADFEGYSQVLGTFMPGSAMLTGTTLMAK
jgi:hypothetical protein